jgi:TetR/AcrR family transcriptional regulator, transcriptional repressor for nem operon
MARNKAFDESAVLDKAMEVFWSQGYCATSMEALVDGMGINRASMYSTYGDKHQLYLKALNNYRQRQAREMVALLEQTPSVKEALQMLLRNVLQESACAEKKGCFIVNSAVEFATRDAAVLEIVKTNLQTVENALAAAIARGQASGEITSQQSPEALAAFLLNTVNGMRVAEKAGYEAPHYEAIISVVESILFE